MGTERENSLAHRPHGNRRGNSLIRPFGPPSPCGRRIFWQCTIRVSVYNAPTEEHSMSRFSSLRTTLERGVRLLASRISWLFVHLFGQWQWQAPAWLKWAGLQWTRFVRYLAADRKRAAGFLLVVIAAGAGIWWYATRPKPDYVEYAVTPPPF